MKKSILFLFILISSVVFAQSAKYQKVKYVKVIQKVCSNQKGIQLVLKETLLDSRCPVGVSCIWAGEIKILVAVYQDKKLIKEETLTISGNTTKENLAWFAQYLQADKRNLKSINVLPYPKEGVKIKAKDYYLSIGYIK